MLWTLFNKEIEQTQPYLDVVDSKGVGRRVTRAKAGICSELRCKVRVRVRVRVRVS
jgi:hypothetical protein